MGVFAQVLTIAAGQIRSDSPQTGRDRRGFAGWFFERFRHPGVSAPRLTVVERISIAPKQSLALVEADGQKLLVATGFEGSPSFCLLTGRPQPEWRKDHGEIPLEGTIG